MFVIIQGGRIVSAVPSLLPSPSSVFSSSVSGDMIGVCFCSLCSCVACSSVLFSDRQSYSLPLFLCSVMVKGGEWGEMLIVSLAGVSP